MQGQNSAQFSVFVLVPGEPIGKGRPRAMIMGKGPNARVHMYTPEKTLNYERLIQLEAAQSMRGASPIASPCQLELRCVFPIPASYTKQKRAQCLSGEIVPTKKPDIDNVLKIVCDAFNGIVWTDDVVCTRVVVEKAFGEVPHIQATVTLLDKLCS